MTLQYPDLDQYERLVLSRPGRLELRRFLIAVRDVSEETTVLGLPWRLVPQAYMTLDEARRAYDDGKVDMCQGREGNLILQYAIPRRFPAPHRNHFFGGGER